MEIKCSNCNNYISVESRFCPNCGKAMTLGATIPGPKSKPTRQACPDGNCTGAIGPDGKCRTCGKNQTWLPPQSTYPKPAGRVERPWLLRHWRLALGIGLGVYLLWFIQDNQPGRVQVRPPEASAAVKKGSDNDPVQQALWMEKGKRAVKARLKDPDSAQFRNVYFSIGKKSSVPFTCGEVNSRNSFGGFGGFQLFVSAGAPELTFLQDDVKDFHELWLDSCAK